MVLRARWLVRAPRESSAGTAGLLAECRDDVLVEVGVADELAAVAEEVLARQAGLPVGEVGLGRSDQLPGVDEFADQWVDGLGEGEAGLVLRDVQQADRVGLAGPLVRSFVPGDAVQVEAAEFVHAAAA